MHAHELREIHALERIADALEQIATVKAGYIKKEETIKDKPKDETALTLKQAVDGISATSLLLYSVRLLLSGIDVKYGRPDKQLGELRDKYFLPSSWEMYTKLKEPTRYIVTSFQENAKETLAELRSFQQYVALLPTIYPELSNDPINNSVYTLAKELLDNTVDFLDGIVRAPKQFRMGLDDLVRRND